MVETGFVYLRNMLPKVEVTVKEHQNYTTAATCLVNDKDNWPSAQKETFNLNFIVFLVIKLNLTGDC